jgi:sugar phosphate isomerase/epimerase
MPRTEVRAMTDPVRRDLLRGSATLAAGHAAARLLPPSLASADGGPTVLGRPVGLQLYSLRQLFPKDVAGTLAKVYELGFLEVEGGGDYGLGVAGFMGALKKAGLTLTSALFGYEDWGKDTAAAVRRAREFGALYAGCAWIPHKDRFTREDCLRAAADFNEWGRAAKEAGVRFIYHIHGFEFEASAEGTLFDTLAKETDPAVVAFEADIFWVRRGGADPVALFERYPGRIPLTHLKDIAKGTDICKPNGKAPDETSVPLGSGMIDWPAVLAAAQKAGVERHFIEDEHPEALAQIPQSLRFLAAFR